MTLVAIEIAPRNISLVISDLDYQFSYYLQGSKKLPPILFFHGFMGNKDVFADTISLLSDQFYCLAVDLPRHGNTIIKGGDECYQMDNTALALVEWLDKLTIDQCFLVGYSMGGRLALYLACFFPERFPKVVLESSSPGLKTRGEREERREGDRQLAKQLSTGNFSSFLSQWYQKPLFNSLRKHPQFQELKQRRLANNPLELAKSLLHMGTGSQPSLWHQLPNLSNDLLLLVGEGDNKFKEINTEMAIICKNAKLEIIRNCGHNIHICNVNQFVNHLRQFFNP